ncbi:uncharacterized protein LOC133199882 [Saccostrea echinata]|uniref:uncharacterized protein LOC133199882 n=1 Tax=Saccostrea echinata TaxID=191078 RepID=UPI002A7F139C|nr:uncharacterized protein LOC133199882 [Saccostrea echinata]
MASKPKRKRASKPAPPSPVLSTSPTIPSTVPVSTQSSILITPSSPPIEHLVDTCMAAILPKLKETITSLIKDAQSPTNQIATANPGPSQSPEPQLPEPQSSALQHITGDTSATDSTIQSQLSEDGHGKYLSSKDFSSSLRSTADFLISTSLSQDSLNSYKNIFSRYKDFIKLHIHPNQNPLPPSLDHLLLCIAYCYRQNLAASTTKTHISALSFTFKLGNYQDLTQHFLVKKQLLGFNKLSPSTDTRLPITRSILTKLIHVLPHISNSAFIRIMLHSMFLLAFYAFLRIGELTKTGSVKQHYILAKHLKFITNDQSENCIELTIPHGKHSNKSAILQIPQNPNELLCPYKACKKFLSLRAHHSLNEALFSFMDSIPVSRKFFTDHLQLAFSACGVPRNLYQAHSFRIGAATAAAESGWSDTQIQYMGRWKSTAFRKYIRIPVLKL